MKNPEEPLAPEQEEQPETSSTESDPGEQTIELVGEVIQTGGEEIPEEQEDAQQEETSEEDRGDIPPEELAIDSPSPTVQAESQLLVIVPEPTIITGTVAELFNFVESFEQSTYDNALSVSASMTEMSGGVKLPAIFQHPPAEDESSLRYTVDLPGLTEGERLVLSFCIGLRDGIPSGDIEWDGVRFAIEINGDRVFSGFSDQNVWQEHLIDITDFASQQATFVWITDAGEQGNSNYDWALWGSPRVLRLRHLEDGLPELFTQGWLLGQPDDETLLGGFEFDFPEGKPVEELAMYGRQELAKRWEKPVNAVAVLVYEPELSLVHLGPTVAIITTGTDFYIQCVVKNVGKVKVGSSQKLSVALEGVRLSRDRVEKNIGALQPGQEHQIRWHVRSFSREKIVNVSATLKHAIGDKVSTQTIRAAFPINRAAPRLSKRAGKELACSLEETHLLLENEYVRAVFVHGQRGLDYCQLFAVRSGNYQLVGSLNDLASLGYMDADGHPASFVFRPTQYKISGSNTYDATLIFEETHSDAQGGNWSFAASFKLEPGAKHFQVNYHLSVDQPRELLYFHGPTLHAGDHAFGTQKNFALFPGLEYLEEDEISSNPRDADPPMHLRLVPHPSKITLPLMVVEHGSMLVGLLWDPLQKWDGEHTGISAQFASPNWYEQQENHLMRLFVPTVPEWVPENQESANQPYPMEPQRPITIEARILIDGSGHLLDSIRHWTDIYGLPQPAESPRDDAAEIRLSRHAFMETVWDAENQRSRHCVDWASANAPGFATLLWYDYLATGDEEPLERMRLIAQRTLEESGPSGLISTANCHILRWEFPFYYGHVEEAIDAVRGNITGILAQQEEDGSWRFRPRDERTQTLGKEGDAVLGTCAHHAWTLLKFARVTGDELALKAGLKALNFMKRFKVPRGAQAWECPLYEPDILAAAHAIGAYVEAYRITEDERDLHQAEYWARTGLPFLYHWNYPDRPGMRYASIPVFGTTFYTHSWLGVPVQWNGLVYAYHVQHLADCLGKDFWRTVAEGILISAMHQQWTEGNLKGTYPDGFYGYCTEGRGPHINPEDIMVNLFALRGTDPDISTAIVKAETGRIHISSGAEVSDAQINADKRLSFELKYAPGQRSLTLVTRIDSPENIRIDGKTFEKNAGDELGWTYNPDKRVLTLCVHHESERRKIEIRPSTPVSVEDSAESSLEEATEE